MTSETSLARKHELEPEPEQEAPHVNGLPAPDEMERAAMAKAAASLLERKRRFQVGVADDGRMSATHNNANGYSVRAMDAFGTSSPEFAMHVMDRLAICLKSHHGDEPPTNVTQQQFNSALAFVDGYSPANEVEAMAAATLYAANDLALVMLARTKQASDVATLEASASVALRLLRATTAQMEALAKLKRGGEQTVRVEHVHVYSGGQAIVGTINGGGVSGNVGGQSHEPGRSAEGVTPLLGVDPAGDVVSVSSDAKRAMSDPRWSQSRRAKG